MSISLQDMHGAQKLLDAALPAALKVLAALAIFFVGKWLAAALLKLVRAAMHRGRVDETLADFLGNLFYGLAIAIIVLSALAQVGVDTTSAAAVVGGAALAVGLSLQSQLASLAAGVIIILFRPFKKGDFVAIGASGVQGVVEEIKIISTQLRTPDNRELIVPNASITGNIITNFTARPTRRIDLTVSVSYESDLRKARRILEELLAAEPRVLKSPAPVVQIKALAESSVDFDVQPWARTAEWPEVQADLLERIKLRFDEEGVEIPYKKMSVQVDGLEQLKIATKQ